MTIKKILVEPDPILRKKCEPVGNINLEIKKLMDDMLETMYAAPELAWQLFKWEFSEEL